MDTLELRLLGGFRARWGDRAVVGFESQKVRALLAFLALNRHTAPTRERTAAMLWPDEPTEVSRKNLRQALYNLRGTILRSCSPDAGEPLVATHESLQLNPAFPWWIDVGEFESAAASAAAEAGAGDGERLSRAAQLYRGDLLPGFFVRDSSAFEEWLLGEQERLREVAIHLLRKLLADQQRRGELEQGIVTARRLLELDPLYEETHRELMRLYVQTNRRCSAIAQYKHLSELLAKELGVEPLAETTRLHRQLIEQQPPEDRSGEAAAGRAVAIAPLVGRDESRRQLVTSWQMARRRGARLALIEGPAGVGKTRLTRTVLREITGEPGQVIVLSLGSPDTGAMRPLQLVRELVADTWRRATPEDRARIEDQRRPLLAQLRPLLGGAPGVPSDAPAANRRALLAGVAELMRALQPGLRGERNGRAVIVVVDDLHRADLGTHELLAELLAAFEEQPLWLLATRRAPGAGTAACDWLADLRLTGRVDEIRLTPLGLSAIEDLAQALVGPQSRGSLARVLARETGGLPAAVVETLHALHDAGIRVHAEGAWRLTGDPGELPVHGGGMGHVARWRADQLPSSFAGLLRVAAVIGLRTPVELLRRSGKEHEAVTRLAIQELVDRAFLRPVVRGWQAVRPPDRQLATHDNASTYEFTHSLVRAAIYETIRPEERQRLHRRVAETLIGLQDAGSDSDAVVAYHLLMAGDGERARPFLEAATAHALSLGADDVAEHYRQMIRREVEVTRGRHEGRRFTTLRRPASARDDSGEIRLAGH